MRKQKDFKVLGHTFEEIHISKNNIPSSVYGLCEKLKKETSKRNFYLHEEQCEHHIFVFLQTQEKYTTGDLNILENCVKREMSSNNVFLKKEFLNFDEIDSENLWVSIISIEKKNRANHATVQQEYQTKFEESVAEKSLDRESSQAEELFLEKFALGEISKEAYIEQSIAINKASSAGEIKKIIQNSKANTPLSLLD